MEQYNQLDTLKLYELDAAIAMFQFQIDEETGELLNADALDALQMAREKKLENIACLYKSKRAEAEAVKAEEKAQKTRRERLEREAEGLKSYLDNSLNGEKLKSSRVTISYRSTSRLEVSDAAAAVSWLEGHGCEMAVRRKEPEIDKSLVREILDQGSVIPGVEKVTGLSIQIK